MTVAEKIKSLWEAITQTPREDTATLRKHLKETNEIVFSDDTKTDDVYAVLGYIEIIYSYSHSAGLYNDFEYYEKLLEFYVHIINTFEDNEFQQALWRKFIYNVIVNGFSCLMTHNRQDKEQADELIKKISDTTFNLVKEIMTEFEQFPNVYIPKLVELYNRLNAVEYSDHFRMLTPEFQQFIITNAFHQNNVRLNISVADNNDDYEGYDNEDDIALTEDNESQTELEKIPDPKIVGNYKYGDWIMTVTEEVMPHYDGPMYHFYLTGLGRTLGMFAIPKDKMEASVEDVVLWNIEDEISRFEDIYYRRGDYADDLEDDDFDEDLYTITSIEDSHLEAVVKHILQTHNFTIDGQDTLNVEILDYDGEVIYMEINGAEFIMPLWDIRYDNNKCHLKYSFHLCNSEKNEPQFFSGETTIVLSE